MNTQRRIEILEEKFRKGACSKAELQELYGLLHATDEDQQLEELIDEQWASLEFTDGLNEVESRRLFEAIKRRIQPAKPISKQIRWVSGIAASLLLIGLIGWLVREEFTGFNEIAEVQWVTRSTKNGQRASITLKDGTVVTLNAGSAISFPEQFAADSRQVRLSGEAFFSVKRDPSRPFSVQSQQVKTTALGTSFNIRSFYKQHTEVTVATGKVHVESMESGAPAQAALIPNQQAVIYAGEAITVKEVDISKYLAWKNNELYFEMEPFAEVVETLERCYDVQIELKNTLSDHCLVRAHYKNEALSTVLDGLQLLIDFDYTITNENKVQIQGHGCAH